MAAAREGRRKAWRFHSGRGSPPRIVRAKTCRIVKGGRGGAMGKQLPLTACFVLLVNNGTAANTRRQPAENERHGATRLARTRRFLRPRTIRQPGFCPRRGGNFQFLPRKLPLLRHAPRQ